MKPIIRWTIGPIFPKGLDCLKQSIASIKHIFGDCDLYVFYNQMDPELIKLIEIDAKIIPSDKKSFFLRPTIGYNVHWKLYPPRLDINRHEIFIDNDIILFKKPKAMEDFLNNNDRILLYEGLYKSYGFFQSYFEEKDTQINSGIFGIPPNYNLEEKCKEACEETGFNTWSGKFDEQGLIAYTLTKEKYELIRLKEVPIIEHNGCLGEKQCGYHFVGINYFKKHYGWQEYNNKIYL